MMKAFERLSSVNRGRLVKGRPHPSVMAALRWPVLDMKARGMADRIEEVRGRLLQSNKLISWQRPWLDKSSELREHLNLGSDTGAYETTITVANAAKASRSPKDCALLLSLVSAVKPRSIIEMGTNVGISGAYLYAGLGHSEGTLRTLEGSASKAELARQTFSALGMQRAEVIVGDFAETLEPSLESAKSIDLAFIDGFHEKEATIHYHRIFKKFTAAGAVLVYDDIRWSEGMRKAWRRLIDDQDVVWAVDMRSFGVVGLA